MIIGKKIMKICTIFIIIVCLMYNINPLISFGSQSEIHVYPFDSEKQEYDYKKTVNSIKLKKNEEFKLRVYFEATGGYGQNATWFHDKDIIDFSLKSISEGSYIGDGTVKGIKEGTTDIWLVIFTLGKRLSKDEIKRQIFEVINEGKSQAYLTVDAYKKITVTVGNPNSSGGSGSSGGGSSSSGGGSSSSGETSVNEPEGENLELNILDEKFTEQFNPNNTGGEWLSDPFIKIIIPVVNKILSLLQVLGAILMVIMLALAGFNSILGTGDGLADDLGLAQAKSTNEYGYESVKAQMINKTLLSKIIRRGVLGAFFLFMGSTLVKIVIKIVSGL